MPDYIINSIKCTKPHFSSTDDTTIWTLTFTGSYSFRSAYEEIKPKRDLHQNILNIWNKNIPTKISFFMWKVINNLQPFQEKLYLFGNNGTFKCPFCNNFDTRDHCYTSCDLSKNLWTHYGNLLNIRNHYSESL
ncbi:unnamed protein product [Cuscuta epithymum]|uniref:Reverse transcriptase zinc-binding domain-containing protein n=1 Tax=Cuscuta epithymum TaxID=186058 RepID=A0AAV0G7X3_9ASTE|nr:unnamed protein product [Cuscuta epithymum]